jgi:L1 cell adhesion molecule like protein
VACRKELEGVCNPIISKMYGAGGEGGMPGGAGMPGGGPAPASGPTVEEVD